MNQVLLSLLSGLRLGGVLAAVGLGLVFVFRATSTLNFAQGQFVAIAAFIVAAAGAGALPIAGTMALGVAIGIGLGVVAVVGGLFYVLVLRYLSDRELIVPLIASFAVAGILDAILRLIFGSSVYNLRIPFLPDHVVHIGSVRTSASFVIVTGFLLAVSLVTFLVVRFTNVGLRLRAAGQNPLLASQGRINSRLYHLVSWLVAGVLAGVAGISYGATAAVSPDIKNLALAAFPAVLLGGLDSIEGAIVGGLCIGILEGFVTNYIGGQAVNPIVYGILLIVLLVRPQGLFGSRAVMRL